MINYDEIPEPFIVKKVDGRYVPGKMGLFGMKTWGDEFYGPTDFESFADAKDFIFRHIGYKNNTE